MRLRELEKSNRRKEGRELGLVIRYLGHLRALSALRTPCRVFFYCPIFVRANYGASDGIQTRDH